MCENDRVYGEAIAIFMLQTDKFPIKKCIMSDLRIFIVYERHDELFLTPTNETSFYPCLQITIALYVGLLLKTHKNPMIADLFTWFTILMIFKCAFS